MQELGTCKLVLCLPAAPCYIQPTEDSWRRLQGWRRKRALLLPVYLLVLCSCHEMGIQQLSIVPAITHSSSRSWIRFTASPALAELALLHPHRDINTSHHQFPPNCPSSVVPPPSSRDSSTSWSVHLSQTEFELHGANPSSFWEFAMNCIYVLPQNPCVETLVPSVMVFGDRAFGRCLSHSLLFSPLFFLPLLPLSPYGQKAAVHKLARLHQTQLCHTLIFDFSASRSVRYKC